MPKTIEIQVPVKGDLVEIYADPDEGEIRILHEYHLEIVSFNEKTWRVKCKLLHEGKPVRPKFDFETGYSPVTIFSIQPNLTPTKDKCPWRIDACQQHDYFLEAVGLSRYDDDDED